MCNMIERIRHTLKKYVFLNLFIIGASILCFTQDLGAQSYDATVTKIQFLYGVGRGPTHAAPDNIGDYYRGYGLPGTLIEITAQMSVSGSPSPMYGDVTFNVQYTDGTNTGVFNVTIPSGQNVASSVLPYNDSSGFLDAWISAGTTSLVTYSISGIIGDYTGSLTSAPTETIYWDRRNPPDAPVVTSIIASTNSFKLFWTPVDSVSSGSIDKDFYEYRVHYREAGETTLRQWDGDNDPTLRGLVNNTPPGSGTDSTLHFLSGAKYTTITNLKLYTRYEYFLTAVDIYGNEIQIDLANLNNLSTLPYSIIAYISDGITDYKDFSDLSNPQSRSVRETNIEVELNIVTSESIPDTVRVWFANYSDNTNMVDTSSNTINQSAFASDALYNIEAIRKGPNKWIAFLSTQTSVVSQNNSVRFIVETISGGVSSFSDTDVSDENPNDDEWTFYVGTSANFKPWPARILNNVITKKYPLAYPSYYLSEDAYVTISVFDIKGRPVATILDEVFRRGGQNIKEDGWPGTNKSRKKLGVGLYYIRFLAKRVSDGKIILNKAKKVVMAR